MYLVTKYVNTSLKDYLLKANRKGTPISLAEQCLFLQQIAKGLSKLHSKYIVHRDLRIEAIKVKTKKQKLYMQIGNLDFAI